jgi:glycosyltransferase involved in cell wall biosynthesis
VTPSLSICVPTFERPLLLARALTSVVDQDGPDAARVELLVCDNSPDVSKPIVEAQLQRWSGPTAYIPNVPALEPISNFNECIARSTGQYVLLLHDDDYLLPGSVAAILEAIETAPDKAVLLFGVDIVDEQGRRRRRQAFRIPRRLTPREAMLRLLTDSSFVRIPAIVLRRDVFETVGTFDESVMNPTDFDLMVRIFATYGVSCEVPTIAAYSVHAQGSTSGMFHAETIATLLTIFDRARSLGVLPEETIRRCEADWFHHFILGGTYRQLRAGELHQARTILALFKLPGVAALGPSNRWRPLRWLFAAIVRLPPRLATGLMRSVGRASPERFWLSW